jgi:hypothetical protein
VPNILRIWAREGSKGISLETQTIDGQTMTSAEAIERFRERSRPSDW